MIKFDDLFMISDSASLSPVTLAAISSIISSLTFLVIGVLIGALFGYKFSKRHNVHIPVESSNQPQLDLQRSQPPTGANALYDDVLLTKKEEITLELTENVAYGQIKNDRRQMITVTT